MENLTPMMQQYMKLKEQNKDSILFFRLGDFYEMFFDDAITASKELEIALTKRDCGNNQKCPMCGIPYHVADTYISKLVEKGYKVAICEQLEDPKEAKGIVKRGIIDKITPGTIINKDSSQSSDFNYLMSICTDGNIVTLAYLDILDGNIQFTKVRFSNIEELEKKIENEIIKVNPSEIIYNENSVLSQKFFNNLSELNNITLTISENISEENHLKLFEEKEIKSDLKDLKEYKAIGMLLSYIYNYRDENLTHIKNAHYFEIDRYLNIDSHTIINLEIHKNLSTGSKRGSLYSILNKTSTSMGSRLLHSFLERPLMDKNEIIIRQEIVNSFYNSRALQINISNLLKEIYDLERLIGKLSFGRANARDLESLKVSIEKLPEIKRVILESGNEILKSIVEDLDTLEDIFKLLDKSIVEDPPILITEGNIIKVGFDKHLDEIRDNRVKGKKRLIEYEQELKEETGIKNIKVVFNKKLGYFLDVTKSNLKLVPDYFERQQTLTNSERFITKELKEIENMILSSDSEIVNLEYDIFNRIRMQILDCINRIKETSNTISKIDVFNSLAIVAYENKYTKPTLNNIGLIQIEGGRHPIVENSIGLENFICNDTTIGLGYNDIQILTGPNMSGKSTYLRQIAIIVIMAQIGSFVPAEAANIGIVDKIFTRIGASDNLYKGESTFMVEMNEVSNIIKNSTKDSLLILDEVGRGTSTFDGLSIAWAVLEYISKKIKAKTLFATHYHELTELEEKMDNIINLKVKIQENKDGIIFLRKIVEGKSNRSYGIEVAKIAGLPLELINRAQKILSNIEKERENDSDIIEDSLFDMNYDEEFNYPYENFIDEIKNIDVNMLTPMQALSKLDEIIKEAKDL